LDSAQNTAPEHCKASGQGAVSIEQLEGTAILSERGELKDQLYASDRANTDPALRSG
jgi:hypothetical protein